MNAASQDAPARPDSSGQTAAADRDNGGGEDRVVGPPPPVPGAVDWRALAKDHGVTVGGLLRKAREFAMARSLPQPAAIEEVTDEQVVADIMDWLG